jgi:hypothetical protein
MIKQRLEDKLAYYESIGEVEKAQQLERAAANGGNIDAALAALDAEKEFQTTVESIKESIGAIAAGPAMKLANAMSEMLISGTGLYKVLWGIGLLLNAMSVGKLVTGLIQAAMAAGSLAVMSAGAASALTLGVAALAIAGGVALIMSGVNSAADQAEERATKKVTPKFENGGIIPGNSYTGDNVKANVNSGEMVLNGSQQKNLFDLANGKASKGNNNIDLSPLIEAINGLKSDMKALASRPINVKTSVQLDGKKVIIGLAEFKNTQGDANRVGDFQIS